MTVHRSRPTVRADAGAPRPQPRDRESRRGSQPPGQPRQRRWWVGSRAPIRARPTRPPPARRPSFPCRCRKAAGRGRPRRSAATPGGPRPATARRSPGRARWWSRPPRRCDRFPIGDAPRRRLVEEARLCRARPTAWSLATTTPLSAQRRVSHPPIVGTIDAPGEQGAAEAAGTLTVREHPGPDHHRAGLRTGHSRGLRRAAPRRRLNPIAGGPSGPLSCYDLRRKRAPR